MTHWCLQSKSQMFNCWWLAMCLVHAHKPEIFFDTVYWCKCIVNCHWCNQVVGVLLLFVKKPSICLSINSVLMLHIRVAAVYMYFATEMLFESLTVPLLVSGGGEVIMSVWIVTRAAVAVGMPHSKVHSLSVCIYTLCMWPVCCMRFLCQMSWSYLFSSNKGWLEVGKIEHEIHFCKKIILPENIQSRDTRF